ncbi:thioredoxin [Salinarchaeum sp. Harcht-Bsk1]|uniref:glutaredoxin family protein n=1 Tax=Salinarchaeum sp. Harcht-Bsk1 TaxID=1333523 RepID=UPI0003422909|nr:glutaredoxin family protein [Salinarchaeum sp. Harcht-Bsk1]AGN00053.1 thioredoxin [Salinarchaeum sp. Harcht-Bsk1]
MAAVEATVYTRSNCDLCDDAVETIETIAAQEDVDLDLSLVDVDEDPELRDEYGERVPYVVLNDRPAFKYSVDPASARSKLRALAADSS